MAIETIALLGFAFMTFALAAMAYERRMDVLYGPYIYGRDAQHWLAPLVKCRSRQLRTDGDSK